MITQFRLEVQVVESVCNFRLSLGTELPLSATVPYPTTVINAYKRWRKTYMEFYQEPNLITPKASSSQPSESPLRGWAGESGALPPMKRDRETELRQAELTLIAEFKDWLNRRELVPIRARLAQAQTQTKLETLSSVTASGEAVANLVNVFLYCYSSDLSRLPWEDWKIIDFGTPRQIRFVRSPLNIPEPTSTLVPRRQLRLLAILGDNSGQNFAAEKAALKRLEPQVKVEFEGWQRTSGIQGIDLKRRICSQIEDPEGWDILFFAGHSNEKEHAGGAISIAPDQWMLITELLPSLQIAKERGLQFAVFNSCKGLDIAESLIKIGLSQVVVMREPVHNEVAVIFLKEFAAKLKQRQDFHTAFLSACNHLKQVDEQKENPFPSAYLIPSLFCHPNAQSITLSDWRVRDWLRQMLPKRREAIVLSACLVLSLIPSVQEQLLNLRTFWQAIYRIGTVQTVNIGTSPVLLVQIDKKALEEGSVKKRSDGITDRGALAELVKQLAASDVKIIGFDYIFNRPTDQDVELAKAIADARTQRRVKFIFAEATTPEGTLSVSSTTKFAESQTALYGCLNLDRNQYLQYLKFPGEQICRSTRYHFAHILAITHLYYNAYPQNQIKLSQNSTINFQEQLLINTGKSSQQQLVTLSSLKESPITDFSRYFNQLWLQPIIDYSISPESVFKTISAHDLLTQKSAVIPNESHIKIAIIAAGGQEDSGVMAGIPDRFGLPMAVGLWRELERSNTTASTLFPSITGGEVLAYNIEHFLKQRFIVPIPDIWMVLLVGLAARSLQLSPTFASRKWVWLSGAIGYTIISLQIYITAAILFPWLLPMVIWIWYGLPCFRRKTHV